MGWCQGQQTCSPSPELRLGKGHTASPTEDTLQGEPPSLGFIVVHGRTSVTALLGPAPREEDGRTEQAGGVGCGAGFWPALYGGSDPMGPAVVTSDRDSVVNSQ